MGKKNKYKRREGQSPQTPAPEADSPKTANSAAAKDAAAEADGKGGVAVLVAACGVFILAYVALLGGAASGKIDFATMFGVDSTRSWVLLQVLLEGKYDFFESNQANSNFYWSLATIWPWYMLFGRVAGIYAWVFALGVFSAVGWILLCAAVFGRSTSRAALVVILHSIPFLVMGWNGGKIFYSHLIPLYHIAAWVAMPWLMWLGARVVQGGGYGYAVALALFTAVQVVSDPVMVPWFCAPFMFTLALMYRAVSRKKAKNKAGAGVIANLKLAFVAGVAGVVAGYAATKVLTFGAREYQQRVSSLPSFEHVIDTVINVLKFLGLVASNHPVLALVWIGFAVVSWRFFAPVFRRGVQEPIAHQLVLLFVPLSIAASVAAVIVTGLFPFMSDEDLAAAGGFGTKRYVQLVPADREIGTIARYFLPLVLFPLFTAWSLYVPRIRLHFLGGALLVLAAAAIPRAAAVSVEGLNPYSHPFYECMLSAAKRLNAKSVMSPTYSRELFFHPQWKWEHYIPIGVARGRQGYIYSDGGPNRQMKMGPFDFVVTNASRGVFAADGPAREPYICTNDEWHKCASRFHTSAILDGQAVRAAFGEPTEVIECPGNQAIYYYNPPIEVKDVAPVGSLVAGPFTIEGWSQPADR